MSGNGAIKVCFAATGFGKGLFLGGPSYSQRDSLLALLASDADVWVLSREAYALPAAAGKYTSRRPSELTIPETRPLAPRLDRTLPRRFAAWCRDAIRDRQFRRAALALRPDVLWVEDLFAHRMAEEVRNWDVARRVFMMRGSPDQVARKHTDKASQLARCLAELKPYTHFACPSARVLDMWRGFPELSDKTFLHLPNCAREEEAQALAGEPRGAVREKLGLPKDRFIMVCVGSVQYRKGQDILIRQFARGRNKWPEALLLLVGIVTDFGGEQVSELIKEFELGESVRLLGHRPEALEFIRSADLFVLPSWEEALPLAVLEAMALKTPVVASNVCGIPEMIRDGRDGLLMDPAQPDTLGEALRRMYEEPALRERCAESAHARYWEQFSRRNHIARYRKALEAMAGSASVG